MNGNTRIHGICNVACHATRPEGTDTYYATKADRDAALKVARADAVNAGLSRSASVAGIYPIKARLSDVRREFDGRNVKVVGDDLLDSVC